MNAKRQKKKRPSNQAAKKRPSTIALRNVSVGANSAEIENDLTDNFISFGNLEAICDPSSAKSFVIGRTGAGKSALLEMVSVENEHVIKLDAESLSLNYISNSDIFKFLSSMDVNLSLFYKLLWRHVLVVELLNAYFKFSNYRTPREGIDAIFKLFGWTSKETKMRGYLDRWSSEFWLDSEERTKQISRMIEEGVEGELGAELEAFRGKAGMRSATSEKVDIEIVERAQHVVNTVQIKEMSDIITLLKDKVFQPGGDVFYITIDRLDSEWVDGGIKYDLIKALLDTVIYFRKVRGVKILVALREDAWEYILNNYQDDDFQHEKIRDFEYRLSYTHDNLFDCIQKRIKNKFYNLYTRQNVTFRDIFPESMPSKIKCFQYIVNRTLMRPRDIIEFVNQIFEGLDAPEVKVSDITQAEMKYSKNRKRSLTDEWRRIHPCLDLYFNLIEMQGKNFIFSQVENSEVENLIYEVVSYYQANGKALHDSVSVECMKFFDSSADSVTANVYIEAVKKNLIKIMIKIGALNIYRDGQNPTSGFYAGDDFDDQWFSDKCKIRVHPMLHGALGMNSRA